MSGHGPDTDTDTDTDTDNFEKASHIDPPHRAGDRLMTSNFNKAYWTMAQMVSPPTVNGFNLQSGHLLVTGKLTTTDPIESAHCLNSAKMVKNRSVEQQRNTNFFEDDDSVILRSYCERASACRIGFVECRTTVLQSARHAENLKSTPINRFAAESVLHHHIFRTNQSL